MSLIAKLWPGAARTATEAGHNCNLGAEDRNTLNSIADRVRILLFRECEWRGRKLLFDSKALERSRRCHVESHENNNAPPSACRNYVKSGSVKGSRRESSVSELNDGGVACEHGKLLSEDISLLSEMIFGTVAMTYRGPSFKIHAMNAPECIMCTKVFPYAEHSVCRQSDKHSSELLNGSGTFDTNSSNSSIRNHSRPGSGNSLSPTLRKNSTCSSTGSGWDIDVPCLGSSHSLNGSSGLASNGSLASLRRRWMRAMTTSLSRSEFDDTFGHNYENSSTEGGEVQARRHKTRLGLAMILQLPSGNEKTMSNRLLEHAALLESMLDHLRHSCVEGKGPERNLINRLYRASSSCTLRLLDLLLSLESKAPTPLLWHDLLLSSSLPVELQIHYVTHSLQEMCQLLDECDVKSTNFFLSTIVTAVLTHHLGWVHTAPPRRNRQLMESMDHQYPCNPLWIQLNDLFGAIGMPARIAHTVIVGKPEKAKLIESILSFLSYFMRSGLVEKRIEIRDPSQEDVQEAIAIIERAVRRNPSLEHPSSSWSCSSFNKRSAKSSLRRIKHLELANGEDDVPFTKIKSKSFEELQKSSKFKLDSDCGDSSKEKIHKFESNPKSENLVPKTIEETSLKKLKRSGTAHKNLSDFTLDLMNGESSDRNEIDKGETSSKVKIIVSDEDERKTYKDNMLLQNLEKTFDKKINGSQSEQKMLLRQKKLTGLQNYDWNTKTFDEQTVAFTLNFPDDSLQQETKSQVHFTLGGEEKTNLSIRERLKSARKCQCSYTFTRVPSTSAELPEGVLRKILQRNFPESSKNMQPSTDCESDFGVCIKCHRGYVGSSQGFESKLLLETPTNATEVLKGCNNMAISNKVFGPNSLEALIKANCVIELPMPRSKKISPLLRKKSSERVGFAKSLLNTKITNVDENAINLESNYTYGMVSQGFTKKKKKGRRKVNDKTNAKSLSEEEIPKTTENEEWWRSIQEALSVEAKFPLIDQPVSEVFCILGDLDNWQVGLLSNHSNGSIPVPVGMSSLVSNMLEAFAYMWKEARSPEQCIKLLESRLREMWLRSETLAEFLLATDLNDASVGNLTSFLDVDAADLPLLLAVATTHTPQIAQRFGLTLA